MGNVQGEKLFSDLLAQFMKVPESAEAKTLVYNFIERMKQQISWLKEYRYIAPSSGQDEDENELFNKRKKLGTALER